MDNFTAVAIAEGFQECDSEEEYLAAWQHLHNTGLAYALQGWFGRTAQQLHAEGLIEETEQASPEATTEEVRQNDENLARELGPGPADLPPGYKVLCDGIIDPYYAIKDDDLGTIVGGTHPFRRQAIADAWWHHNGNQAPPQRQSTRMKFPFEQQYQD